MQDWQTLQTKIIRFHKSEQKTCRIEFLRKAPIKSTIQYYICCDPDEWLHSFVLKTNIITLDKIEVYISRDNYEIPLHLKKCDDGYQLYQSDVEFIYKNSDFRIVFKYPEIGIANLKFELSCMSFILHAPLQSLNFIKFGLYYNKQYLVLHNNLIYDIADYNAKKLIKNIYAEIKKECSHYVDKEYTETFIISPKSGVN